MAETVKATKKATETKELKLDFIRMCQARNERFKREEKAREYIKKIQIRKQRKEEQSAKIMCVCAIVIGIVCAFMFVEPKEVQSQTDVYTYTTEIQTEPERLYPTERVCKVVGVNESKNIVTVEYNGQQYDFYGNGFLVGETIVCKFTDNMEIVDAER